MAEIFSVTTGKGTEVKGWHWSAENATRNLCVITGMDEYAKRYEPFAEWMSGHGVNVWVLDAIGQGLNAASADRQEEWPDDAFDENVEAIHRMDLMASGNGLPTVQMGHSMGSFMVQSLIENYPCGTDGIILCGSNGGQEGLMKLAYGVARIRVSEKNRNRPDRLLTSLGLGSYSRSIKGRKTDLDWLSYDEENVRRYIADPWCGHENTGGFWREFLKGMKEIWRAQNMKKISAEEKILLIAGADDPVGQCGKGVRWLSDRYRKLGARDVSMKLYPKMRHEILNETDHEKVWQDVLSFVTARG